MDKFPLILLKEDGLPDEPVEINIKKIPASSAVAIFDDRAAVIYKECLRDIPRLQATAAQWAEVLGEVVQITGLPKDSPQLGEFITGYGQARFAVKSAEIEQKKSATRAKKILGELPTEPGPEMPDELTPYARIATQVCGSYLVVEHLTGIRIKAGSCFADSDPDSFFDLCKKVREVNSRFLGNSLFATPDTWTLPAESK